MGRHGHVSACGYKAGPAENVASLSGWRQPPSEEDMANRKKNELPPAMDAQPFAELMQQMAHLPQISPATLAELQADYLKQATALWNGSPRPRHEQNHTP